MLCRRYAERDLPAAGTRSGGGGTQKSQYSGSVDSRSACHYLELGEILDEVNFKWWKDTRIDHERLKEEIVDVHTFRQHVPKAGMGRRATRPMCEKVKRTSRQEGRRAGRLYLEIEVVYNNYTPRPGRCQSAFFEHEF